MYINTEKPYILHRKESYTMALDYLQNHLRFKVKDLREYFFMLGYDLVMVEVGRNEMGVIPISKWNCGWLLNELRRNKKIIRVSRLNHESLIYDENKIHYFGEV